MAATKMEFVSELAFPVAECQQASNFDQGPASKSDQGCGGCRVLDFSLC
jgi:hypothetical protein